MLEYDGDVKEDLCQTFQVSHFFTFDAITILVFWTFYARFAATLVAAFIVSSMDIFFSFLRSPTLFSVKLLRTV